MHAIEHTYISLLADVGRITRDPLIRGSAYEGLQWTVHTAPLLEKDMLTKLEDPAHDFCLDWPRWLVPLRNRVIRAQRNNDLLSAAFHLKALRQILLFCYKAEHTSDEATKAKAYNTWYETNHTIRDWDYLNIGSLSRIIDRARRHVTSAIGLGEWDKITPFHGPGAVTDKSSRQRGWSRWYPTIETCYPYCEFFDVGNNVITDVEPAIEDAITAKLIDVPKDARGPRLICVHPAEAIWIQQGLRVELESCIARSRTRGKWVGPSGFINFDDQTVNATLALSGSSTKQWATIDLKEASDRLSEVLVQDLFGRHYRWFGCCRAQYVTSPYRASDEQIYSYAPMGNATTFPVQSLVFWALCVATLEARGVHHPACYVFGDDIIVPNEYYGPICETLELCGLVVNRTKSFHKGWFRESCGTDAFAGFNVTPLRWKTTYDAIGATGLQSMSTLAQNLRIAGYTEAALTLYDHLAARMEARGKVLPVTNNPDHGGIAEYDSEPYSVWEWAKFDPDLHVWKSPVYRLNSEDLCPREHYWCNVLSSLSRLSKLGPVKYGAYVPRTSSTSLPELGMPRSQRILRGWVSIL